MIQDRIHIEGLVVECVIGILPQERMREQVLRVDVELGVSTVEAGLSGRIAATADYDRVSEEITALLRFRRYKLLEMAAEEVSAMIFGVHPCVQDLRLRLTKPRALEGRAKGAGVSVLRYARDRGRRHERADFGSVEVLLETKEAGLYLLHVEPGKEIPAHFHRVMRELEWLVDGCVERDGRAVEGFEPTVWPRERVHRYRNLGEERATLFCCDCPPFLPDDEVVVE